MEDRILVMESLKKIVSMLRSRPEHFNLISRVQSLGRLLGFKFTLYLLNNFIYDELICSSYEFNVNVT